MPSKPLKTFSRLPPRPLRTFPLPGPPRLSQTLPTLQTAPQTCHMSLKPLRWECLGGFGRAWECLRGLGFLWFCERSQKNDPSPPRPDGLERPWLSEQAGSGSSSRPGQADFQHFQYFMFFSFFLAFQAPRKLSLPRLWSLPK